MQLKFQFEKVSAKRSDIQEKNHALKNIKGSNMQKVDDTKK